MAATPSTAPLAKSLKIAILGAGIGGASTALALARQGFTDITVFESARALGEVGAGINITPNLARVLKRLDCLDEAAREAVALSGYRVLESDSDEELSYVDMQYLLDDHGMQFLVVHRKDLQKAIVDGCYKHPSIKFRMGHTILRVDYEKNRVLVKDNTKMSSSQTEKAEQAQTKNESVGAESKAVGEEGAEWFEADVILGADGVRSVARRDMLKLEGEEDHIEDTGQAAYRVLLTRDEMKDDPELLALIDGKTTHRWIGHKRHIISYPICNNQIFNISTAHPDTHFASGPTSSWTSASGTKAELLETFSTFCPRVQKMLNLVPEGTVLEWRLRVHLPLKTWVRGNVALLGDAAHSTLPHLAQGAAQAVEDAAVLAVVLSKIDKKEDVHAALKVYEAMRKERAEYAVAQAAANGRELHLAEGDDREARNERFRKADKKGGTNPDKQVDRELQKFLYGVDIALETEKQWDEKFKQVQGQ